MRLTGTLPKDTRKQKMSKLACSIIAENVEEAIKQIKQAELQGAEIIEIRLDYLSGDMNFGKLADSTPLPIIWTLRCDSEGGKFTGGIESQLTILLDAIKAGGNYIDIEYHRWIEAYELKKHFTNEIQKLKASGRDIKIIFSFHDFTGTPHWISALVERIEKDKYCDIVKVACKINNICENFYIFDLLKLQTTPTIAIGMGNLGKISRILTPKFNGYLTFAALDESKTSAPGQLTIEELKKEYQWGKINKNTLIAGVIGYPVEHSLSPQMHNRIYDKMNVNAVYLKFEVNPRLGDFALFMDFVRRRADYGFLGLSITIPHKRNALQYLNEHNFKVEALAEKIGAVNTIIFHPDGRVEGANTDYIGAIRAIEERAGLNAEKLKDKKVAILGAGGVARAIVCAMKYYGANVTIYNRTESKAKSLAEEFDCEYKPWNERNNLRADILINCTSLGMKGYDQISPIDEKAITENMIVFDTVYIPMDTPLIKTAKGKGAKVIEGMYMLIYQAIEQIKLWTAAYNINTGEIPADVMFNALAKKLQN